MEGNRRKKNSRASTSVRKCRDIDTSTLRSLMTKQTDLTIIDTRSHEEYEKGHIPGAYHVPYSELETRVKELQDQHAPIVVISGSGIRSQAVCRLLTDRGFKKTFNVTGGMASWTGKREYGQPPESRLEISPSGLLVDNIDVLPKGKALDLAMGYGRNALFLAKSGYEVEGIDISTECVTRVRKLAEAAGLDLTADCADLEKGHEIKEEAYDLIICFLYLHRPLFPAIIRGVKPGGAVVYETFTVDQVRFGRPKNPEHLLKPNELLQVFSNWRILAYREGIVDERKALEGIVAVKTGM